MVSDASKDLVIVRGATPAVGELTAALSDLGRHLPDTATRAAVVDHVEPTAARTRLSHPEPATAATAPHPLSTTTAAAAAAALAIAATAIATAITTAFATAFATFRANVNHVIGQFNNV